MSDLMQSLVAEAKKNKYSAISDQLSDDDVVHVWNNVSSFIEKQMSQQKGVHILGLGTFTLSQKKLDVGNNNYILIQRPVFQLSEKFAQLHGLNYTKHHTSGSIPVVQLNYAALASDSPHERDTVEACVRELLQAMQRSVGAKRAVEFTFAGIGRLQIRDNKVKMKFYKEFLNSMDGSGRLADALKDRPGTVDSVISQISDVACPSPRLQGSAMVLPRISPVPDNEDAQLSLSPKLPTIAENNISDVVEPDEVASPRPAGSPPLAVAPPLPCSPLAREPMDDGAMRGNTPRRSSRLSLTPSRTGAESVSAGALPKPPSIRGKASPMATPSPRPHTLTPLHLAPAVDELYKQAIEDRMHLNCIPETLDTINQDESVGKVRFAEEVTCSAVEPPQQPETSIPEKESEERALSPQCEEATAPAASSSPCGHKSAGQELCYLCYQRDRRNVPVDFSEERNRREQELDRHVQQYQHYMDAQEEMAEQECNAAKREENQNVASFNLSVAEALNNRQMTRPTDFHRSYVFQNRPLTPPRFIQQNKYFKDLSEQVEINRQNGQKCNEDREFLERLEQVQLAEDLAAQREKYLQEKNDEQEAYKRALSAQIQVRDLARSPTTLREKLQNNTKRSQLQLSTAEIVVPSSQTVPLRIQASPKPGTSYSKKTIRLSPVPQGTRVLESTQTNEPVFGQNDMTSAMMAERRRRAHDLYRAQLSTVEQRKREAVLGKLKEQQEEDAMLERTKKELRDDRAERFGRMFMARKRLEDDWHNATNKKQDAELEERKYTRTPGALVHEQCLRYKRCGQCERQLINCGESNIWRESRYIPGSRLMV